MTERLRIAILCYPSLGGSGVIAAELARGLAERGHRVHVIASAPPRRVLPESERLRLHVAEMPAYPVFEHPPYELAMTAAIVDVARHGLDVVHVHYAVPHAASAFLARQVLGAAAPPAVVTLHGTDVTRVGSAPSQRAVLRLALGDAAAITVPSAYLRAAAQQMLDLDAGALAVVRNFVDTERFRPAVPRDRTRFDPYFPAGTAPGPVLVHVSNFRAVKRTPDLMDVLARIRQEIPARLVLIGDGPERDAAAARAAALGLADSVAFLGQRADFAGDLAHADGFLLPSEDESFGVAALEALSAGVPVFAYRVGGLPEVIGEGTGALVEPYDVAALARAVVDALGDPARQARLAAAARAHAVAHFSREQALDEYEAIYRRVRVAAAPQQPPSDAEGDAA